MAAGKQRGETGTPDKSRTNQVALAPNVGLKSPAGGRHPERPTARIQFRQRLTIAGGLRQNSNAGDHSQRPDYYIDVRNHSPRLRSRDNRRER